jgi:hypothetical protein
MLNSDKPKRPAIATATDVTTIDAGSENAVFNEYRRMTYNGNWLDISLHC